jgi:hypothetical protein
MPPFTAGNTGNGIRGGPTTVCDARQFPRHWRRVFWPAVARQPLFSDGDRESSFG